MPQDLTYLWNPKTESDTNVFTNRNRLSDTNGWLPKGKLGGISEGWD